MAATHVNSVGGVQCQRRNRRCPPKTGHAYVGVVDLALSKTSRPLAAALVAKRHALLGPLDLGLFQLTQRGLAVGLGQLGRAEGLALPLAFEDLVVPVCARDPTSRIFVSGTAPVRLVHQ